MWLLFFLYLVIAINIDPVKIVFVIRNADICGVTHKIEFIVRDFFKLTPSLKSDVMFMSPSWGGPDYSINRSKFTPYIMYADHYGGYFSYSFQVFNLVKNIAPNIAFCLPKTINIQEVGYKSKKIILFLLE